MIMIIINIWYVIFMFRKDMLKTISFAIMHFSIAFLVAYLLTGDILIGGLIALVEPSVNSIAYFFHEKIWDKLRYEKSML